MDRGSDLYQLRDQLLALDDGDRDNLRALLDHETQRSEVRTTSEEDMVWAAIRRLAPHGSRHFKSLSEFLRDKRHGVGHLDYGDAVRTVFDLVLEAKPVRHPHQDAAALVELVLECLTADMRTRNVELTPKQIVGAVPRLRAAIEDCYPGYVAAGMLHRLIRVAEPA